MSARLPRDLHPVAWWAWALGLAAAASLTTNPLLLGMVLGVVTLTVLVRRGTQPWSRSFRIYVWLGVAVVVIRVLFRVLVGGYPGTVVVDLPRVPLPDWVLGISVLGPVTREALLGGLYDGLRLATVIVCVGGANALANPKRLLRSVPPALYEVGTALVVAVSVLPQLADSARRVRAAQALRAGESRRVRGLRRVLVPVLEDAVDRSLALAAGMDARGYGRAGTDTPARRRMTGGLMLAGLCGLAVGGYALLDTTAPRLLGGPMLGAGAVLAAAGLVSAGRRVRRSRYRPDPWRWPELAVVASGLLAGAAGWELSREQIPVAYPNPAGSPPVTLAALAVALLGLVAVVCAPPPKELP